LIACGGGGAGSAPSDSGADATLTDAAGDASAEDAAAPDALVPRGARTLGLDISPNEDNDYMRALGLARDAGVQSTNVSLDWDAIELEDLDAGADAGVDAGISYYNPYLHIANLVFPSTSTGIALAIRPIDTNVLHVPKSLAGKPFDDAEVIARFNAM